jgi:flagellar basal-body rod protein FlgG
MNGAFYIGSIGLQSQQRALEVIANNIANINTPAFKRSETRFSELLGVAGGDPSAPTSQAMEGVMSEVSPPVFSQGELRTTGKPMDVAIDGDGFLELLGHDGKALLWRGGTLSVNADGFLAAGGSGLALKTMIAVPREATSVTIDRDGRVRAVTAEAPGGEEIGQLEVVRARDGALAAPVGGGLYEVTSDSDLTAATPGEDGAGAIVQGALEGSNVELADQMVTLMLLQRAFAANAQVVQAGDQLMAITNGLRR